MRRIVKFSFVVVTLSALVATLVSVGPAPANASGSAPVHVVNTPLPVTGDVTATLSGPVTTTITGPVEIGNAATNPVLVRDVDGAPEHFQQRLQINLPSGGVGIIDFDPVPAGKRLVVEYVSVELGASIGACFVATFPAQDFSELCALKPTFGQPSGALQPPWGAAWPTTFSVTPGNWVRVDANGQQPILTNPWSVAASISGYFVPYP